MVTNKIVKLIIKEPYPDKQIVDIHIENINCYIEPLRAIDKKLADEIIKKFNESNQLTII